MIWHSDTFTQNQDDWHQENPETGCHPNRIRRISRYKLFQLMFTKFILVRHVFFNWLCFKLFLGFVEVCIMHPLDLVKTRLQIQTKVGFGGGVHYDGVFDCFRKMYQQEGLRSYYKGILPPILAETPKRAVKVVLTIIKKIVCYCGCFFSSLPLSSTRSSSCLDRSLQHLW